MSVGVLRDQDETFEERRTSETFYYKGLILKVRL